MASKHKITAYTSDTHLYEWATNAAEKKGMKRSAYLESLIREEMQHPEKEDASTALKTRFTIFEKFIPNEDILSHSFDCQVTDLPPPYSRRLREKAILSQLGVCINNDICTDFFGVALKKYIKKPEGEFHAVFVKLAYDGRLLKEKGALSLKCLSHITYLPLLITRELWDKYEGRYDFFNIRYLRQSDIINGDISHFAKKYAGISPLFERRRLHNDSGGFFIPVFHHPVSLEQRLMSAELVKKLAGSDCLYTGVSASNSKERFCLKERESAVLI